MPLSLARRLDAYLAAAALRGPFDWGRNNCCHFAFGWVREVEGRDPLADLAMADERAALRIIARYGGLEHAISARLARAVQPVGQAQVGDVILLPLSRLGGAEARFTVGLCFGRTAVFLLEDGAFAHWPTLEATHAWRVIERAAPEARPA